MIALKGEGDPSHCMWLFHALLDAIASPTVWRPAGRIDLDTKATIKALC